MKNSSQLIYISDARIILSIIICCFYFTRTAFAQKATIKEEKKTLKTYSFGKPNPIPVLTENPKIYPYFKFNEYQHQGVPKEWKVVTLENAYIKLFVLPEVGGKVWGAIEKSTGKEFIYRNEVMKFRNIAMRGPWTSGGIEFNFGIIGHTPSTATSVDYLIKEHEDGSVSCVVGNIDLPSRTQWRVAITLPKDAAYFETNAFWYNPTTQHQSYYNWMTAAAVAKEDLELFCPGNQYLKHNGEPMPWPYDSNQNKISAYRENDYGSHKSYHVVGEYNDFFGGYYHNDKFGFGHWSLYEEIPGQKLWLWALSRSGGIWEDLLTDTDGQYIEFQAGRLFNQYFPDQHNNPITQATFSPYTGDTWREIWFPIKQIGGLSDVSPYGALNVTSDKNKISLGINALQRTNGTLELKVNDQLIHTEKLNFDPMGVFTKEFELDENDTFEFSIKEMDLSYGSNKETKILDRPFTSVADSNQSESEKLYNEALELMEYRDYIGAQQKFEACLKLYSSDQRSMISLAELFYRKGAYKRGLKLVRNALSLDTYDPKANYVAGIIYQALNDKINALETFGWAARSMEYRSSSFAQMAEIYLSQGNLKMAGLYANKALDFNRYNLNAYQVLAIVGRKSNDAEKSKGTLKQLLEIDPLNHFAYFEQYLLNKDPSGLSQFRRHIQNEFPDQTIIELAIDYWKKGLNIEAKELFKLTDQNPIALFWLAYLNSTNENDVKKYIKAALIPSPDFIFPFRRETLHVLEWILTKDQNWKTKYYTALNYWGRYSLEEAAKLMESCGDNPDYYPFYLARAKLLNKLNNVDEEKDIKIAIELAENDWLVWDKLTQYYKKKENYQQELTIATNGYKKFPGNYNLGLNYAGSLLHNNMYSKCLKILSDINILPFEGASESRKIYEQAHISLSLQHINKRKYKSAITVLKEGLKWPENIGVGKPYDPDMRKMEYLLAHIYAQLDQSEFQEIYIKKVMDYTKDNYLSGHANNLLGLMAMRDMGEKELAGKLITNLKQGPEADNPINKWVMAQYDGIQTDIEKIENTTDDGSLFQTQDFQILKNIISLKNSR